MELKEFDLDLPYIANEKRIKSIIQEKKCLQNEATKLDYGLNWKDKRCMLRLETRCISAMFERLFGKMKTKDCWKVLVECVEVVKEERVLNFSGVYTVQVQFDYSDFFCSDDYQKKKKTLCVLMEGIRIIAKSKGWALEPFETVYLSILERNYINEWVWKKPVKSPNRKLTAEVLCQHEVKCIDIYLVLRDIKGKELAKEKIISDISDEFAYTKHLGELKWLSNSEVVLVNKKGDNTWTANFKLATKL